ncbi:hypothetical protein QBC33DRAFT_501041 [Phialemonium atrogriseum]|uniref:Uncharacterized protein n=1 Tax=Phialemonium atrogriseum TaxID=1093897 RepID=A0AAJ0BSH4_9PEZI|nr:uncharacterized protein QBC33DRAFT_501041 [Phialemonium atrogriseum]KAK1762573.1 hypothetical protein QBC33DRAFT_501041 [Phialemonium atrogriseum]
MPTLLEALTRRNVVINSDAVVPGGNTTVITSILPENWSPWLDFNYATLTRIFRRELASEYQGSPEQRPLVEDLTINNEETLEDLLRRFVAPVVNYALDGQAGQCHLGRGSRCGAKDRPDWSVISPMRLDEYGRHANMLPGDTKLDAKWWPTMVEEDESNFAQWQKVVAQAETYMALHRSRYGFILTDRDLVVLRITRQPIDPGLAQGRPQREITGAGHSRQTSDATMESSVVSSYRDNNGMEWDYSEPEYATIPWAAHGYGNLTIKLSLWCLAMMATNGDAFIDYSYPGLDSWRAADKGYVHNTSGAAKAKLSKEDAFQEPDPDRPWRERAAHEAAAVPPGSYYGGIQSPGGGDGGANFSQAGSTFDEGHGQGYGGSNNKGDNQSDQQSDQTVVGSSRKHDKRDTRKHVTGKRHKTGKKKLYFVNANGYEVDTSKKDWTKVEGGYEYKGRKYVYFTKGFPE